METRYKKILVYSFLVSCYGFVRCEDTPQTSKRSSNFVVSTPPTVKHNRQGQETGSQSPTPNSSESIFNTTPPNQISRQQNVTATPVRRVRRNRVSSTNFPVLDFTQAPNIPYISAFPEQNSQQNVTAPVTPPRQINNVQIRRNLRQQRDRINRRNRWRRPRRAPLNANRPIPPLDLSPANLQSIQSISLPRSVSRPLSPNAFRRFLSILFASLDSQERSLLMRLFDLGGL